MARRDLADNWTSQAPANAYCWAICERQRNAAIRVRMIVWRRAVARQKKRHGEVIRRAFVSTKIS